MLYVQKKNKDRSVYKGFLELCIIIADDAVSKKTNNIKEDNIKTILNSSKDIKNFLGITGK